MSVTIASTTDTQEDVNKAAGIPVSATTPETPEEIKNKAEGKRPDTEVVSGAEPEKKDPAKDDKSAAPKKEPKEKSESETDDDEEEEKPRKKGGFQRRIDRLTGDKHELLDENRSLREKLALVEKGTGKDAGDQPKKEPAEAKPTRDKFQTDADFYEALGRYGANQEIKKSQQTEAQKAMEAQQAETYKTYQNAVSDFVKEHDDFVEVVGNDRIMIPVAVQLAIVEYGPQGPAIAYHLGNNPDIAEKLAKMSDVRAVAEIGRLAATLEKDSGEAAEAEVLKGNEPAPGKEVAKEKTIKPGSKAPTPIAPVGDSLDTKTNQPVDELDYQEYRKVRDAQDKKRFRR